MSAIALPSPLDTRPRRGVLSGLRALFAAGAAVIGPTGRRSVSATGAAVVKNTDDECPECGCGGGGVTVLCPSCSSCGGLGGTPNLIDVVVSGVSACTCTVCVSPASYRVDTLSVNGTHEVASTGSCSWTKTLPSAVTYTTFTAALCGGTPAQATLDATLTVSKTSATVWTVTITATHGATTLSIFSGTATVTSNDCLTDPVVTNTNACGCTGSTIRAGALGSATLTTHRWFPDEIEVTLTGITTCAPACVNNCRLDSGDGNGTFTVALTGSGSDYAQYDRQSPTPAFVFTRYDNFSNCTSAAVCSRSIGTILQVVLRCVGGEIKIDHVSFILSCSGSNCSGCTSCNFTSYSIFSPTASSSGFNKDEPMPSANTSGDCWAGVRVAYGGTATVTW